MQEPIILEGDEDPEGEEVWDLEEGDEEGEEEGDEEVEEQPQEAGEEAELEGARRLLSCLEAVCVCAHLADCEL